jgi:hypothetical protein
VDKVPVASLENPDRTAGVCLPGRTRVAIAATPITPIAILVNEYIN